MLGHASTGLTCHVLQQWSIVANDRAATLACASRRPCAWRPFVSMGRPPAAACASPSLHRLACTGGKRHNHSTLRYGEIRLAYAATACLCRGSSSPNGKSLSRRPVSRRAAMSRRCFLFCSSVLVLPILSRQRACALPSATGSALSHAFGRVRSLSRALHTYIYRSLCLQVLTKYNLFAYGSLAFDLVARAVA